MKCDLMKWLGKAVSEGISPRELVKHLVSEGTIYIVIELLKSLFWF
jgi:hypothetical protein